MQFTKYLASSRFFAFLAGSCAAAAVAWASRDPSLLIIGILGLAAGHFYSWYKRDSFSKRRTLTLVLFMVVLTVYLGEELLFSGVSDRVLLSRFLVYGLVLASFDMTRKRNVMGSLVLGGLLLVLISELALSLWFLVFMILFTILALTAVAVSRIEADMIQAVPVGELRWFTAGKAWLGFAASVLLLSTILFLLMPRLAGSELAQAGWLPSRLDLSLAGSPILPSRPSASVSWGILPSRQDGEALDGQRYATLGYIGSSADKAVMHVRSRVSSYWRGLTLDEYDGRGWLPSSPEVRLRNESRGEFILPDSQVNLSGERVYWQAYYMLSDQPNAVFTGYNPGRVYLPELEQTFLERGTLYRALSLVPYLKPELLREDRVVSDDIYNLILPPISERTAALAESIVQGAPTDYDRAARLERFLLTNYPYKLNAEPLPSGYDAVDFFLFEQQAGYCSHFATTMAVMARHVSLPARVAAGYLPGFIDPMTGAHIVRTGDAHAWVEIHFQRYGWVAFDPTPRADAAMGFASGRNWVYFGLEDFTGVTFAGMLSPLAGNLSFGSLSIPGWVSVVVFGAGVIAMILALLFGRHRPSTLLEVKGYSALDGETRKTMVNLYHKMVALLVKGGLPARQPYQPPYEYAAVVYPQIPDSQNMVEWLTQVASSAAYDPEPFNSSLIPEARRKLSALRRTLTGRR